MLKNLKSVFLLVGLLALAGLACGPSVPDVPEGAVETAQAAGEQAGNVAETAVALATQEGVTAIETIQAGGQSIDLGPLQDKLESIQPDENGNYTVTITDDELNQAIQRSQEAAEGTTEATLQQAAVVFTGGNIVLTANVTSPITAELTVTFRPFISNGVIQFEVVSATLGSVQVPTAVLSSAALTLNNTLGQAMNSIPSNVTLQSIVMGEGTMTISGTRQ
jgi:hypothetical protein